MYHEFSYEVLLWLYPEEDGTIHPAWWLKAELVQNFSHPVHLTFGSQGSNISVILFISAWLYWNYVTNVYIFNIKQYKICYKKKFCQHIVLFHFPLLSPVLCNMPPLPFPVNSTMSKNSRQPHLRLKWSPLRKQPWCAHFAPHMILYNVNKWP